MSTCYVNLCYCDYPESYVKLLCKLKKNKKILKKALTKLHLSFIIINVVRNKKGEKKMIKIDRRKKYLLVIDVETSNNDFSSRNNDGLVYDIGYQVIDKKGNIYQQASLIIKEIFTDGQMMDTAYYAKKIPQYIEQLKTKVSRMVTILQARKEIQEVVKQYNITEVWAYNASFDLTTLNNTIRYVTSSYVRYFLPYGTQICDIWSVACQVLGTQKTFIRQNVVNARNNLITNAERMFQYISCQEDFTEEHTGLEDVKIECEILVRCLRQHKKINKNINRSCWRIPQKAKKELLAS